VTVVNIDNGFGAAYVASMILRRIRMAEQAHSQYNEVS
jgi:NCAIR mutase (PurE)-related protein